MICFTFLGKRKAKYIKQGRRMEGFIMGEKGKEQVTFGLKVSIQIFLST